MLLFIALVLAQIDPAPLLPPGFNPEPYYLPSATDMGSPTSPRGAAALAEGLVAHGAPENIEIAEQLIDAILAAQETRDGAAHRGNFRWTFREGAIGDLNSVEFTLRHLIPMMIAHADRLKPDTRDRLRNAIRLGLEEIDRMNVDITYTNVAAMGAMNIILGGELLEDADFANRGYARLKQLEHETLSRGTFCEYNTPTYTRVTHEALTRIATYTTNEEAAIRARTLRTRLALTAALHLHPETGRWAGPHGRGHRYTRIEDIVPEGQYLDKWIAMDAAPEAFAGMLAHRPLPYAVWESVYPERNIGIMSYLHPAFTLGTATREISRQSDVFLVHATRADGAPPVTIQSRYLIDSPEDAPETDRRRRGVEGEQGKFYGVQQGAQAIGLYAPRTLEHPGSLAPASLNRFQSAKVLIAFIGRGPDDRAWAGEDTITKFPRDLDPGTVAVVECGEALVAILPLSRDDLGFGAPLRLVRRDGHLALEIYNYLGPETVFWDMDRESRFFQGKPRAGFYAEVAPSSAWPDGAAFARAVASGNLRDDAEPPVTAYQDNTERRWTVEYARDGETVGIEIDLIAWSLKRRWYADGDLGWPMLESPIARQTGTGRVEVAGAVLACGKAPAWLFAAPEQDLYIAGYHGEPAPLTLQTPRGAVSLASMGTGVLTWQAGELTVDALHASTPRVTRTSE